MSDLTLNNLRARIAALEAERDAANQRCKELGCTMEREFIKFEKRIAELLETQAEYDKKITRDEKRIAALEAERDRLAGLLREISKDCREYAENPHNYDTPLGIEHLGDVRRYFHKLRERVQAALAGEDAP